MNYWELDKFVALFLCNKQNTWTNQRFSILRLKKSGGLKLKNSPRQFWRATSSLKGLPWSMFVREWKGWKSDGARSWEYGGCGITSQTSFEISAFVTSAVWGLRGTNIDTLTVVFWLKTSGIHTPNSWTSLVECESRSMADWTVF